MKRALRIATRAALLGAFSGLVGWTLLPKPPLLDGVAFSTCVLDRDHRVLRVTLTPDEKLRIFTPIGEIPRSMINATLAYEDRHFGRHFGVNPVALFRAALRNATGRSAGGASTITMQVARLRFGMNTRTLSGKCRQILRALELERHYSKSEILSAYLNLAPYGRNIEGVGAAARAYWDKPAALLTLPEAIALAVIPQSPTRRALSVRDGCGEGARAAQRRLAARLGCPPEIACFTPVAQPAVWAAAPHFIAQVLRENGGEAREIVTTLDPALQRTMARAITRHIETHRRLGVHNAAALLLDWRSMEVLAQCGSADFFDATIHGQVDGTRSARSPGSTLKPFVYALALDQGLIHPLSVLHDLPRSFGGYEPENFERDFAGPIRACDALARSRNLPAIGLAARLKHPAFYHWLKSTGVPLPRGESDYGLSLALGGAEVTMADLLRLYAMLANGGELKPVQRTLPHREAGSRKLLSREAAFLTLGMLRQPWTGWDSGAPVFWKTGTSHGFRDAWCIAVSGRYVVAVWVGNFDGVPNAAFIGGKMAAPLLFSIVNALPDRSHGESVLDHPPEHANLRRVEFCAVSGQLPNAWCAHRTTGWFIPGVSPLGECNLHREIEQRNRGIRPAKGGEFWPSDLLVHFRKEGVAREHPLPHIGDQEVEEMSRRGFPPEITSPQPGLRYRLEVDGSRQLLLAARADGDVRTLYWFTGRRFIAATAPGETCLWRPDGSETAVTVLDDHGRAATCALMLEWGH
jgi:penicillin-binding protein 1C